MPRTRRAFLTGTAAAGAALYLGSRDVAHAPPEAPNVLVVVIDSLRADHGFGPGARTPALDSLAAQGLSFTSAVPEAMPTVPARNSLLSGRRRFPFRDWEFHEGLINKPGWEPLDDITETFLNRLKRAGWWTGYVTDNPFLGFSRPYEPLRNDVNRFIRHGGQIGGLDGPVPASTLDPWIHPAVRRAHKVERVRRYIANADYAKDETRSFAANVFSSGVHALEQAARNRPFALVVDSFEPHEPWTPPRRYLRDYGDPDYRGPEPGMLAYARVDAWIEPDERELVLDRLRAVYAAEVAMTDHWLGVLLERLRDLDLERETIVALVADHGIQLGERGWTGKISVALHPELVNVPIVIVHPERLRAGETSDYYASLHDIGPTLLTMAGVRTPSYMDGADLSVLFDGDEPPERPFAYGGYSNSHFYRDENWVYMSDNARESPQLFDLAADPGEVNNLAEERPEMVEELYAMVEESAGGPFESYD